ncbi:hypothetical protein V8C43DRAFT_177815 [Trichoderma afarasin]
MSGSITTNQLWEMLSSNGISRFGEALVPAVAWAISVPVWRGPLLVCEFVQTTAIDASRLAIITPYKANMDYIAHRHRGPPYLRHAPCCNCGFQSKLCVE